jgi:hypothetical protein
VGFVFGVTAVFPLLVVAAALLISEERAASPALTPANGAEEGGAAGGAAESLKSEVVGQVRPVVGWSPIALLDASDLLPKRQTGRQHARRDACSRISW